MFAVASSRVLIVDHVYTDHPSIQPSSFTKAEVSKRYAADYMFMDSIEHILQVTDSLFVSI